MKVLDTDIRGKFGNVATVMMVHRVMVATALLYDHLHPDGIFVRDSPISIIIILELLEDEAGLKRRRTRSRPVQEKRWKRQLLEYEFQFVFCDYLNLLILQPVLYKKEKAALMGKLKIQEI